MKPRHTVLFALLALYVLAVPAVFGQTIKPLSYNTTNFTVIGWTNTSALTFTNAVDFNANVQFFSRIDIWEVVNLVDGTNAAIDFEGGATSTSATLTRSNLFGAVGLTATITNGGLVFVFTNGILASTNAP
jgi:hypothetical protein